MRDSLDNARRRGYATQSITAGLFGLALLAAGCKGGDTPNEMNQVDMKPPVGMDMALGPDVSPPIFAGATSAAATGMNTLDLKWSAASDNRSATGAIVYLIYQATSPGGQTFAQPTYTTTAGATSFVVSGLTAATKYYFVVRAKDEVGLSDMNNREVSATTYQRPDTMAPVFGGVTGATPSGNTVNLSWTAATDDLSMQSQISYLIFASKVSGTFNFGTPLMTSPPGVTQFVVTGLDAQTTYYFVVRAQDAALNKETNVMERMAKTGDISFVTHVQPIFAASCQGGACHSGAMPQEGLNLSAAALTYMSLVNKLAKGCPTDTLVKPSLPDQSYLVWKLMGAGPCFKGVKMPPGGGISEGDLNTVRGWIMAGAPNN